MSGRSSVRRLLPALESSHVLGSNSLHSRLLSLTHPAEPRLRPHAKSSVDFAPPEASAHEAGHEASAHEAGPASKPSSSLGLGVTGSPPWLKGIRGSQGATSSKNFRLSQSRHQARTPVTCHIVPCLLRSASAIASQRSFHQGFSRASSPVDEALADPDPDEPCVEENGDEVASPELVLDEPSALEITAEARAMFHHVYKEILALVGGEHNLAPPKEIVWLNGAPGAGKGANTPFILQTRGFQARSIQVSDLLADNTDVATVMNSGGLVSDSMVLRLVLERILRLGCMKVYTRDADHAEVEDTGESVAGAVVDGFPRTTLQVDFIKLLHDQLMVLHHKHLNTPLESRFPRPIFRIAVLYVDEEESVRRQVGRGRAAMAHNQRVTDSAIGQLVEVRPTDLCEKSARRRYKIFKQHYDTLLRLKAFFPFHLIDGMGTLAECREQIEKELQYQSALELDATTFMAISHIPLASDIAKQARQNMVARLDGYQSHEPELFKQVIDVIAADVVPIIRRSALAGIALFNTENPIFFSAFSGNVAAEMLADILSERGYSVTWQTRQREIPLRVDAVTNEVVCARKTSMQFRIKFERPQLRNSSSGVRSSIASSLLVPKAEEQTEEAGGERKKDSTVCQNYRADGLPACFSCEGDADRGEGATEERGVAIPGLPQGVRIHRDEGCPPLPTWTKKLQQ